MLEEEFYQDDIKAVDKAMQLVDESNSQECVDKIIRVQAV